MNVVAALVNREDAERPTRTGEEGVPPHAVAVVNWFAYLIRLNEEHDLYRQHALRDPYLSAIKRYASLVRSKTTDHAEEDRFIRYGLASMDASKFEYSPPAERSQ